MDQGMYLIESTTAVVFVAIGGAEDEEMGLGLWAEAWLWLRGSEDVQAVRIAVADPLQLPNRVDPVDFLFRRAGAWAANQATAARRVLDRSVCRPVVDEDGPSGLIATLLELAIDAPRLVERIEATTRWHDLEGAVDEAQAYAEEVAVLAMGGGG
ncbi:hypothetical protein Pla163_11240 [Planctomycetes bacterium Pla163]|uniref:Uncharacterized protein n=1 Tax=Rohdeia mirabilis TaxID=2528008 RepID=A0A518CXS0_9BACT|nr:hypothetical protein Pla163_11240 [Planctomycetes bacterium Pla163]